MDSQVDATQDILPTQESLEEEIIEIPDSLGQAMAESKHQFEVEQGMRARGEILPEGGIPVSNDLTEGSEENRAGIEGSKEKQAENEAEGELPSAPGAERWGEKHIRDKEKEQEKEEERKRRKIEEKKEKDQWRPAAPGWYARGQSPPVPAMGPGPKVPAMGWHRARRPPPASAAAASAAPASAEEEEKEQEKEKEKVEEKEKEREEKDGEKMNQKKKPKLA
jgi:hypothetical protein